MKSKTAKMAAGGVLSALALLFLMAASILPGGHLACAALAGVVGAVVLVRCGWKTSAVSWIAVSVLALLLAPSKGCALLYAVFFGPYTLLKNAIERLRNKPVEWVLKYLFCMVVAVLLFLFSSEVLGLFPPMVAGRIWLFLPAVAVVFLAYDIVFSKLIYRILSRLPQEHTK